VFDENIEGICEPAWFNDDEAKDDEGGNADEDEDDIDTKRSFRFST